MMDGSQQIPTIYGTPGSLLIYITLRVVTRPRALFWNPVEQACLYSRNGWRVSGEKINVEYQRKIAVNILELLSAS